MIRLITALANACNPKALLNVLRLLRWLCLSLSPLHCLKHIILPRQRRVLSFFVKCAAHFALGLLLTLAIGQLTFHLNQSDSSRPRQYSPFAKINPNQSRFRLEEAPNVSVINLGSLVPITQTPSALRQYPMQTAIKQLFQKVRVLCWVLTSPKSHRRKAIHVQRTWGKRCNKLLFISTQKDAGLHTVSFNMSEDRKHLWQKTSYALRHIYEHHLGDADWFLKADDDTFVVMENLRSYLGQYDPNHPWYFGFKFNQFMKQGYMSGGAGYVFSRESVKRLILKGFRKNSICDPDSRQEAEDMAIGKCAWAANISATDTRDSEGKLTFLVFPYQYYMSNYLLNLTPWYFKYRASPHPRGPGCCSKNLISLHYVSPEWMNLLDYFIYYRH